MASAYERFNLHTTAETFYLESCKDGSEEVLAIDRVSTEMTLTVRRDVPASADTRTICGLMGTIRLVAGMYLCVITNKKKVGELLGHAVWKAVDFDIISYKKTILHLTDNQMQDNKTFMSMINNVLHTDGFYFATDYDLTHTLQRLANTSPEFQEMSLMERADQRFVWNGHLLREFIAQPELHKYVFPVVHGFITMKSSCVNGKLFEWSVISRRSCFRAGVRYYVREDGLCFEDLFGTRLLREVRAGIAALGDAWWGLYVDAEKLPELKPNTGIVFCRIRSLDLGYLFEIVTDEQTHSVGFCSTPCGCHYVIMKGSTCDPVRIAFKSVLELLACVKKQGRIQFLPMPASVVTRTN